MYKLHDFQLKDSQALQNNVRAFLMEKTGKGKCIPVKTYLHFKDGIHTLSEFISDMKPGEVRDFHKYIWNGDKFVRTKYIYYGGKKATVIMVTDRGKVIEGTPNHKILTERGLVRMDELKLGDTLQSKPFISPYCSTLKVDGNFFFHSRDSLIEAELLSQNYNFEYSGNGYHLFPGVTLKENIVSLSVSESLVADIEVDNDGEWFNDHLFYNNGFINHNTLITLDAFRTLKNEDKLDKLVVFCPKSALDKKVWENEVRQKTDLLFENSSKTEVLVLKYTIVRDEKKYSIIQKFLDKFRCALVLDEVHTLKNPNNSLTPKFVSLIAKANFVWGLTATPLTKTLEDTYHLCNLLRPFYLGTLQYFKTYFCICEKLKIRRAGRIIEIDEIKELDESSGVVERLQNFPIITGESLVIPKFTFINYSLNAEEAVVYKNIAKGLLIKSDDWLNSDNKNSEDYADISDLKKYSSRFLYLQHATDGVYENKELKLNTKDSTKFLKLKSVIDKVLDKNQSILVFFDYYASLDYVASRIKQHYPKVTLLESSGRKVLGPLDKDKVLKKSHIILCTRASAESASYYFINNVCFYNIPTITSCFTQFVGRITRVNTLFPDDLNVYILISETIDLYKMMLCSYKTKLMEQTTGVTEENVPSEYKSLSFSNELMNLQKKLLLWNAKV